jgi:hypothetical protein
LWTQNAAGIYDQEPIDWVLTYEYLQSLEMLPDLFSDPFGESSSMQFSRRIHLLGGHFHFDSNNRQLMNLVESAYAGLPSHRLAVPVPKFQIRLLSAPSAERRLRAQPPPLTMLAGGGLLGGATAQSNFVAISPRGQGAVVVVSRDMLRFPYHARYELIEFAVFTLAARSQGLVPLHAACVGQAGRGLLLMGPSGAGKSTVAMLSLLQGLDFVSEDSVFVSPGTMQATGVANFLHVRSNSLRWIKGTAQATAMRRSPVIQRRSGVKKFEVDLRGGRHRLAPSPLRIVGIVFLSEKSAGKRPLLEPLPKAAMIARLEVAQAYAANQPQWGVFRKNATRINAFELRRGRHPLEAVETLRSLLAG